LDEAPTSLILDFLDWLDEAPRPYSDVMDAWRTSCPRLPVWEDSLERGFVVRTRHDGSEPLVQLTAKGRAFIRSERRVAAAESPA
jgi:hypothetical protein